MPNKVIAGRDKGEMLEFSPEAPPEREDMQFLSGFPGTGIAGCLAVVTHIRTRRPERFRVDRGTALREAPEAVSGVLYFEVQIKERPRGYWPPGEGFFSSREALPKALPY